MSDEAYAEDELNSQIAENLRPPVVNLQHGLSEDEIVERVERSERYLADTVRGCRLEDWEKWAAEQQKVTDDFIEELRNMKNPYTVEGLIERGKRAAHILNDDWVAKHIYHDAPRLEINWKWMVVGVVLTSVALMGLVIYIIDSVELR